MSDSIIIKERQTMTMYNNDDIYQILNEEIETKIKLRVNVDKIDFKCQF